MKVSIGMPKPMYKRQTTVIVSFHLQLDTSYTLLCCPIMH